MAGRALLRQRTDQSGGGEGADPGGGAALQERRFHEQLERAVGGHPSLEAKAVESFARPKCPPYSPREYRRRNGRTVFAQVAETLEQRIGVELMDLLRIAPVLRRCPHCRRIYVRRCGGFLAQGPILIEDCLGRPMRPLAPAEQRDKNAMRQRLRRWRHDFGPDARRVRKLEREYRERFPLRRRGPKPISGDDLLP